MLDVGWNDQTLYEFKNYNLSNAPILINAIFIIALIYFVGKTNSDKSPIIFWIFYPFLFVINLLLFLLLAALKSIYAKTQKQILIALLLLFFPVMIITLSL